MSEETLLAAWSRVRKGHAGSPLQSVNVCETRRKAPENWAFLPVERKAKDSNESIGSK